MGDIVLSGSGPGGGGGGGSVTQGTTPWITATTDTTATGTLTAAAQTVELATDGLTTVGIKIAFTVASTHVIVEGTIDGSEWVSGLSGLKVFDLWFGVLIDSSKTDGAGSTEDWLVPVGGLQKVRVRYVSGTGTIDVAMRGNQSGVQLVTITSAAQGSGNGGTTLTGAGIPWTTRIYGSSELATNQEADVISKHLLTAPAVANAADPGPYSEDYTPPLSIDLSGRLRTKLSSWLGSTAPTVGQKAMASSLPVALASDQSGVPVTIADGSGVTEGAKADTAWDGVAASATVVAILKKIATGGSGGGPATIANGADVAEGATTDAAVITDTTGTISGKLRGLVKWAFERMPAALGQTTMVASLPVTMASNQSDINVKVNVALPAGSAAIGKLAANDGVDIGDVTVNNAAGASAVNIQDGGNSLTVDGTVTTKVSSISATGVMNSGPSTVTITLDGQVGVTALIADSTSDASNAIEFQESSDNFVTHFQRIPFYYSSTQSSSTFSRADSLHTAGVNCSAVLMITPGVTQVRALWDGYVSGSTTVTLFASGIAPRQPWFHDNTTSQSTSVPLATVGDTDQITVTNWAAVRSWLSWFSPFVGTVSFESEGAGGGWYSCPVFRRATGEIMTSFSINDPVVGNFTSEDFEYLIKPADAAVRVRLSTLMTGSIGSIFLTRSVVAYTRPLAPLPGDPITNQAGPIVQAAVRGNSDTAYLDQTVQPLTSTKDGRLRATFKEDNFSGAIEPLIDEIQKLRTLLSFVHGVSL